MREHSDRIVAVSAGVIGLAALAISAYQAYIMREQQRASVWPRIEILMTNSAPVFKLTLSNPGIGPALIHHALVTVDGQPRRTWGDVLAALGAAGPYGQGKIADRVLSPQQTQEIFAPDLQPAITALNEGGERVEFAICYCSIYDECWIARRLLVGGARLTHVAVDACRIDESRRFGQ